MKYDEISKRIATESNISVKDLLDVLSAIMEVYPMIVLANLTQNKYTMLKDEGFLRSRVAAVGNYDDMIEDGKENIHPSYRELFLDTFNRENLIRTYEKGTKEQLVKLYQKDTKGEYHWVSSRAIRVPDESGDIVHICFNSNLEE